MWSAIDEDSGITPQQYDSDHAIGYGNIEPTLTPEEINEYIREKMKALRKMMEMVFDGH